MKPAALAKRRSKVSSFSARAALSRCRALEKSIRRAASTRGAQTRRSWAKGSQIIKHAIFVSLNARKAYLAATGLPGTAALAEGQTLAARPGERAGRACQPADGARCERLIARPPLGPAGRRVWTLGGPVEIRLAAHLAARSGPERERRGTNPAPDGLGAEARHVTAAIRGGNPGRVNDVLAARPLVSAEEVATGAGISRMTTAERMLNRLTQKGVAAPAVVPWE